MSFTSSVEKRTLATNRQCFICYRVTITTMHIRNLTHAYPKIELNAVNKRSTVDISTAACVHALTW